MIRLLVHGGRGRMGTRIGALAGADRRFEVVAAVPPDASPGRGVAVDAIIDFSAPAGTEQATRLAVEHRAALVVGTTGLSPENHRQLDDAARSVPVLVAPNTALGVAVLGRLAVEAARLLGDAFAVEIVETHHAAKRDAPSGTALRLADLLRERAGRPIEREAIRSIRTGDVIGEHELIFTGPRETLRIAHSAGNRDLFAAGALRAAAWLVGQPPGRYGIDDALAGGHEESDDRSD